MAIAFLSLRVSGTATLLAAVVGIPAGFMLAVSRFRGQRTVETVLNTLMALPTVVVGLFLYALLSRRGLLGEVGLLFTPTAMIMGQFILATPIVTALTLSAFRTIDARARETALTLGAGPARAALAVMLEARYATMAAVIAGFGRVIAEVGCSLMVGGNIRWYTRSMTTAIALETGKGEFGLALAIGIILLSVALAANILLHTLQLEKV
ncbi:MAG: ABC transporter permease [Deltaproteobacteria bacterium]|nr:ABC transporter permease [Deltaproteobacteria bacterium]MBW2305422.1 ABC transporter permease [Deltaproteobacteria bacterium]